MTVHLVGLALLMAAVTYPFRALPLFAPAKNRLPPVVQRYLRLVGPAILAALAAGNTAFAEDAGGGRNSFHLGIEWIAVALAVVLIAWRGNVFVGILAAAVMVAIGRALMGA
jgi:branched-subunit amino acid transport protein